MVQRGYVLKVVAAIVTALACIGVLATWVASGNDGSKAAAWRPGHPPVRDGWTRLPTSPLAARHDPVGAFVGTALLILGGSSEPPCPAGASCTVPAEPSLRDGAALDSVTGEWHTIMDAPEPVAAFNVAIIGHMIYVLSANDGRADGGASFLSYDVGRDVWATLPEPPDAEATLVAAGHTVVAIAPSDEHARAVDAAFDVNTQKWRILPDDPLGPSFGREAVWAGDRLLLAASDLALSSKAQQPAVNALATLDRSLEHWSAPLPASGVVGSGPLFASGRVVWPSGGTSDAGGDWDRAYPLGGVLDPITGGWQPIPPNVPDTVGLIPCELVVGGRVCVDGHLLNPVTPVVVGVSSRRGRPL